MYVVPFVKPVIVIGEVVTPPATVCQELPLLVEYWIPVMALSPLALGAVNETVSCESLRADVTEVGASKVTKASPYAIADAVVTEAAEGPEVVFARTCAT